MDCVSCEGFHDASKMMTRFAPTRFVPKHPARVDMRNNLALQEHKNDYSNVIFTVYKILVNENIPRIFR